MNEQEQQIIFRAKQRFLEELSKQIDLIRDYLTRLSSTDVATHGSYEREQLGRLLHTIKGGAGFFSFDRLVDHITSFEEIGVSTGQVDDEKRVLKDIVEIIESILRDN